MPKGPTRCFCLFTHCLSSSLSSAYCSCFCTAINCNAVVANTTCSKSCGSGTLSSTYKILVNGANGGIACTAVNMSVRSLPCNAQACRMLWPWNFFSFSFPENCQIDLCSYADTKSRCVVWFQMLAKTLSCKLSALPFGQCRLCCVAISDMASVLSSGQIELENAVFALFGLLVAVSFEAAYAGPCVPVAYNPSLLRVAPPPSTQHE